MSQLRLFPFSAVEKNSKIAIYGSGAIFNELALQVRASSYCKIQWAIDRNISEKREDVSRRLLFCSPDDMDWDQPDHIIIASIQFRADIENEIFIRKGDLNNVISLTDASVIDLESIYQSDIGDQLIKKLALPASHIENCKLISNRVEMLGLLPKNGVVAEMGSSQWRIFFRHNKA